MVQEGAEDSVDCRVEGAPAWSWGDGIRLAHPSRGSKGKRCMHAKSVRSCPTLCKPM